jgi:hypothetical protein
MASKGEGESPGAETRLEKADQKLIDRAFTLERQLKKAIGMETGAWWAQAKIAYEVHQERAWELLGYEQIGEWLAQPDIGMTRSGFFKRSQTWRDLVEVKHIEVETLKEIEPSKAMEVRPAIMKGDVKPEQALSDAENLSFRDVIEKYRPSKQAQHGQEPDGSTTLDASSEPQRVRCPCCRQWTTKAEIPEKYRKEI